MTCSAAKAYVRWRHGIIFHCRVLFERLFSPFFCSPRCLRGMSNSWQQGVLAGAMRGSRWFFSVLDLTPVLSRLLRKNLFRRPVARWPFLFATLWPVYGSGEELQTAVLVLSPLSIAEIPTPTINRSVRPSPIFSLLSPAPPLLFFLLLHMPSSGRGFFFFCIICPRLCRTRVVLSIADGFAIRHGQQQLLLAGGAGQHVCALRAHPQAVEAPLQSLLG